MVKVNDLIKGFFSNLTNPQQPYFFYLALIAIFFFRTQEFLVSILAVIPTFVLITLLITAKVRFTIMKLAFYAILSIFVAPIIVTFLPSDLSIVMGLIIGVLIFSTILKLVFSEISFQDSLKIVIIMVVIETLLILLVAKTLPLFLGSLIGGM